MKETKSGDYDARLQIKLSPDELHGLKRIALDARVTLTKYVRLKLGLDKTKETK